MKSLSVNLFAFLLVTGIVQLSALQLPHPNDQQSPKVQSGNNRFVRQTETTTTTTPKPKKARPSNIFGLISVLVTETRDDASRAFNEIGTLFNGQFANSTTTKKPESATSTAAPAPSESDEDNEITTTTEPFRITRDEFLGILRSNVRGIANLFGKEFRVAIRDSNDNVREFGRGLGNALRPYFNNN